MQDDNAFTVAYLVAFAVLALGSWLFMRNQSPRRKHYWLPRVSAVSILVLAPFFVLPPILSGQIGVALLFLLALLFIGYVSVAKVRVCQWCGHVTQPENLLVSPSFCAKCGSRLVPPTLTDTPSE